VNARVTELWRYPVKSMLGERLDSAEISEHGVAGDRTFALIDDETGKICSAKRYDLWGDLFSYRASLVRPGLARIVFPDGSEKMTDDPSISSALSENLGRKVTLSATAPPDAKYEEVWDPVKGARMYGPATGEEHSGEAVIDVGASFWSPGDFFDAVAIHFLTTNTIEEFRKREPETTFDVRRFRPNLVFEVDGAEGFVENDWKVVRVGDVELQTVMPVPRCVMTTLPQDDLAKDSNVLRSAARHNMVDTGLLGAMPCAGIYATVSSVGAVRAGDALNVEAR
jgi:uncharacterized protein YcbX